MRVVLSPFVFFLSGKGSHEVKIRSPFSSVFVVETTGDSVPPQELCPGRAAGAELCARCRWGRAGDGSLERASEAPATLRSTRRAAGRAGHTDGEGAEGTEALAWSGFGNLCVARLEGPLSLGCTLWTP